VNLLKVYTGICYTVRTIIIGHGLECEMGQYHTRVHIFKSKLRLAEFLIRENVNLGVELSHLILFDHH